jgi:hypothetical protein
LVDAFIKPQRGNSNPWHVKDITIKEEEEQVDEAKKRAVDTKSRDPMELHCSRCGSNEFEREPRQLRNMEPLCTLCFNQINRVVFAHGGKKNGKIDLDFIFHHSDVDGTSKEDCQVFKRKLNNT